MKQIVIKILVLVLPLILSGFSKSFPAKHQFYHNIKICLDSVPSDTCMIYGMAFEIVDNSETNGLKAIIKNGRVKIIAVDNPNLKFRVIRYVFSINRDEKTSSIRTYGDLVSFLVIDLLKDAQAGDLFNFEDIIIVDPDKEILDNAVKPIIIKKL